MDQIYLEPIIPQVKSLVYIINGEYKGKEAILDKINMGDKSVVVSLVDSKDNINLKFSDICKFTK